MQNASVESDAPIEVRLKLTLNDRTTELKKSLLSRGPGIESLVFPATFGEAGTAQFELTVASGDHRDVTRAAIPVRADGLPVFSSASGTAGQSTIALVDADPRLAMEHPRLEILIGPSVDRTLLDAVLGSGPALRGCDDVLPTNSLERATSDVLGGVALLAMIRTSRSTDTPEATALAVRVRASIAQLVGAARNDGGWSWSGGEHANASDRFLSSRAAWALAGRAAWRICRSLRCFRSGDYLSVVGPGQRRFVTTRRAGDAVSRIVRLRQRGFRHRQPALSRAKSLKQLGPLTRCYGTARLDRKEMAGELLNLVKVDIDAALARQHGTELLDAKAAPALRSGVELRALYLLAIEEIQPTSDKGAKLADWLLAARQGSRWRPDKANGPAVAALARWFRQVKPSNEKYTLTIFVNDHRLETLTVDPSTDASRRLEVPANMLVQGRPQRINFDMEGRGKFSYSAILSGFVPSERLAATTDDWFVQRWYEPAQRMLDGEPVRVDSTSFPAATRFSQRADATSRRHAGRGHAQRLAAPRAGNGRRTARLSRDHRADSGRGERAGRFGPRFVRAVRNLARHDYVLRGDRRTPGELHYTLVGYVPGGFIPRRRSSAASTSRSGSPFRHARRSTCSARHCDARRVQIDAAQTVLSGQAARRQGAVCRGGRLPHATHQAVPLAGHDLPRDGASPLPGGPRHGPKPVDRRVLRDHQGEAARHRDRFPVDPSRGLAYRVLGEYERSFLVYRATLEAAFQRETQIAGFLDDRNQFLRSVQVMERLLGDYPAEAYVATATYSLAQEVYGKRPARPRVRSCSMLA